MQFKTLDELLPEAFATVKSAARRMCGQSYEVCDHMLPWEMVHYDEQFIGGIALHEEPVDPEDPEIPDPSTSPEDALTVSLVPEYNARFGA